MCCDSYSNTTKYHYEWHGVDVEELKKRRDNIAQMLNSKTEMRDELSRAVLSLQRSLSNIEEEIKSLTPVISFETETKMESTYHPTYGGVELLNNVSKELGDMADEL